MGCNTELMEDLSTFDRFCLYAVIIISFFAWFPQYIKLYNKKSCHGLSLVYLFWCNIQHITKITNVIVVHWEQFKFYANPELFWPTTDSLASAHAYFILTAFSWPVYWVAVHYWLNPAPNTLKRVFDESQNAYDLYLDNVNQVASPYLGTLSWVQMCWMAFLFVPTLFACWAWGCSVGLVVWSDINGWMSFCCVLMRFGPQILATWEFRAPGTLSMVTLGWLVVNDGLKVYTNIWVTEEALSTWATRVFALVCKLIILLEVLYFRLVDSDRDGNKSAGTTPSAQPLNTNATSYDPMIGVHHDEFGVATNPSDSLAL